ncbi:MAG TPA: DUF1622 domain-containing protein [Clostridiales bacterium]|nr:DUF1622 domain-containing protein [Clostridiales bacterium]
MELLEEILFHVADYAIVIFELIGMILIIFFVVRAAVNMLRRKKRIRIDFAEGLALSLEFLLASEILRTIVVRDAADLILVGGIVLMRLAFTLLIHWEINCEKKGEE